MLHTSIFEGSINFQDAYSKILKKQERELWLVRISFGLAIALAATSCVWIDHRDFLLFSGLLAAIAGLLVFIEMSNRSFLLHITEFHEWKDRQAKLADHAAQTPQLPIRCSVDSCPHLGSLHSAIRH